MDIIFLLKLLLRLDKIFNLYLKLAFLINKYSYFNLLLLKFIKNFMNNNNLSKKK